jgi:hypothetical protein
VSAPLLAAFGVAGGAPPATMESLRVLADGRARAIVGSAWPDGSPLDEAGLYETTLGDAELERLRALAGDEVLRAAAGEHGPIRGDSGRSSISLGEDATILWGAFAQPPEPVGAAVAELRALLARVREHPVAALHLRLGDGALELSNPGPEPVRFALQVRLGPAEPATPPLSAFRAAAPVSAETGERLAGGERRTVRIDADGAGTAYASGALEVAVDGRPVPLDLFLVAR